MFSTHDEKIDIKRRDQYIDMLSKEEDWRVHRREGVLDNIRFKGAQIKFDESRARRAEHEKYIRIQKQKAKMMNAFKIKLLEKHK